MPFCFMYFCTDRSVLFQSYVVY